LTFILDIKCEKVKYGIIILATSVFFILLGITNNQVLAIDENNKDEIMDEKYTNEQHYSQYSNVKEGIKIIFPDHWKKIEYNSNLDLDRNNKYGDVTFVSPIENKSDVISANLTVYHKSYRFVGLENEVVNSLNSIVNTDDKIHFFNLEPNVTIGNNIAFRLMYDIDHGKNYTTDVTELFVEKNNNYYNLKYSIDGNKSDIFNHYLLPKYNDYLGIGREMFESFNISYAQDFFPPLIIDGKIQKGEWQMADPHSFNVTLVNTTALMPSVYNVTVYPMIDDKNMYLLTKIKGPPQFNGGSTLRYYFDSSTSQDTDSILMKSESNQNSSKKQFVDGFTSGFTSYNDNFLNDSNYDGTEDGFGRVSFSNGAEIFEMSHPLCSSDREHDICVKPGSNVGFRIKIALTNDSASFPRDSCSALISGFAIHWCYMQATSGMFNIFPPVDFVLGIFHRFNETERSTYLNTFDQSKAIDFLKKPDADGLFKILINASHEDLIKFLEKMTPDEFKKMSKALKPVKVNEILNKLTAEERSNIITRSSQR
jgi:hypothetical protein